MTYLQLYNAATGDTTTLSRCMVATSKYARFLIALSPAPSTAKLEWATGAIADTRAAAEKLMWGVVGDPAYIQDGGGISDASLQSALEATVNAIYP